MSIKARRIRLKINSTLHPSGWITVNGFEIDALWAAHRASRYDRWTLTHRPTGYMAGTARTFADVKKLARALVRKVPRKHWHFTDPETVRGNPVFKGCKALRDSYAE